LAIVHDDDDDEKIKQTPPTHIGFVKTIDPLEEESQYWWTREEEVSIDSGGVCKEIPCEANL
jgi:alpha-glucuronidase